MLQERTLAALKLALKAPAIIVITVGLAGCAAQQAQQPQQAMAAALYQQLNEETVACQARFSESNKDAIARAKCINDGYAKIAPKTIYPDLIYLSMAKRTELAEKQAQGKITRAQVVLEMSQQETQIRSEVQRRNVANNVAQAQINANNSLAAAALLQSMQANRPQTYNVNVCNVPGQVNTCIYR